MPRKLRINVQTDRLPDAGKNIQISIRVSAAVSGANGKPLEKKHIALVTPWEWLIAGKQIPWDAHETASWVVWQIGTDNKPVLVKELHRARVVSAPFKDFVKGFTGRLQGEADRIANAVGIESAIAWPGDGAAVSVRTVFGLVEGLTAMPHPVPAATQVFTILEIDASKVTVASGDRFIAAPRFDAPVIGGFTPSDVLPQMLGDSERWQWELKLDTPTDGFEFGEFNMRASWTQDELKPVNGRLIDLETMLIGRPATGSLTDDDWLSDLSMRIAETIDPAARVMAVLDEQLKSAGPDTIDALVKDLRSVDKHFLGALDEVHWAVLSPRIDASHARPAPASSAIEGLALHDQAHWDTALPLMLAQADRRDRKPASLRKSGFSVVSARRIGGLIGMSTDATPDGATLEGAALETEAGFVRWVVGRWLVDDAGERTALDQGGGETALRLAANQTRPLTGRMQIVNAINTSLATTDVPLIDLRQIPGSKRTVVLPLRVHRDAGARQRLRVRLTAVSGLSPQVDIELVTDNTTGSLSINGVKAADLTDVGGDVSLAIRIELSSDANGRTAMLSAGITNGAKGDAVTLDATRTLLVGPLLALLHAAEGSYTNAGVDLGRVSIQSLRAALERSSSANTLRRELSFAFAGPYLQALLAGRQIWKQTTEAAPPTPATLAERLRKSIPAFVEVFYNEQLSRVLPGNIDPKLKTLLESIFAAAKQDAIRRAGLLVPEAAEQKLAKEGEVAEAVDRVTLDARPLVFRIDQLEQFPDDDIWERLAGMGVLIARTDKLTTKPTDWRSLNVATLHAPGTDLDGVRTPLRDGDKGNALKVWDVAELPDRAVVDPVPYQVPDDGAVRAALVVYENRSIVGEMPTDPSMAARSGAADVARRIEAYGFPTPPKGLDSKWRMPALSSGYTYHIVPYVVGHGGVLPPALRGQSPLDLGVELREVLGSKQMFVKPAKAEALEKVSRSVVYRRTRPVGAPRVVDGAKQAGKPDGVEPLAGELPLRLAPVSLEPNSASAFFLDASGERGVIDVPPAEGLLLRIDSAVLGSTDETKKLSVTIVGRRKPAGVVETLATLESSVAVTKDRWQLVRVQLSKNGGEQGSIAAPQIIEDEPPFELTSVAPATKFPDLSTWCELRIQIESQGKWELEPPTVTFITRSPSGDESAYGKPLRPSEASPHSREIIVLDGISPWTGTWPRRRTFQIRRPSVEFATYERWINPPLFEKKSDDKDRLSIVDALNDAYRRTTLSPSDTTTDRRLDDPAVTKMFVEMVRVFPDTAFSKMVQLGPELKTLKEMVGPGTPATLTVDVEPKASEDLIADKQGVTAKCKPGCVYELRIYAGVPGDQASICSLSRSDRFGNAVRRLFRRCPVKGDEGFMLGTPFVYTIETSTSEMPGIERTKNDPVQYIGLELQRPPVAAADWALMRLGDLLTANDVTTYRQMRYVDRATLLSQRWQWRGRPQDDGWPEVTGNAEAVREAVRRCLETAFVDRGDDDTGDIMQRGITRAHVYDGRTQIGPRPKGGRPGPLLFQKDLDYRAGVNFWRFAYVLTSRYQKMRPNSAEFTQSTHMRHEEARARWHYQLVADRPARRVPKRPGLGIVVPLTKPLSGNAAVPPLLALFKEPVHANFHAGDGITALTDVARHPFNPKGLQHFQERGPDPIRTGAAATGHPVALRADGFIGYTHDLEVERGRFDHASMEISPVGASAAEVTPWSLLKLRFRRHEMPEGIDHAIGIAGGGWLPKEAIELALCAPRPLVSGTRVRLANSEAISAASGPQAADIAKVVAKQPVDKLEVDARKLLWDNAAIFPIDHEGLVIDILDPKKFTTSRKFEVRFDEGANMEFVRVTIGATLDITASLLTVTLETHRGDAGKWTQSFGNHVTPSIRLVLSAREKPEQGDTYKPVGDVEVRARFSDDSTTDPLKNLDHNRWLAVASVPLSSSKLVPIADPLVAHIGGEFPANSAMMRPIRLSAFTPPVWCQFAESMSVFSAGMTLIGCDDLQASVSGTTVALSANSGSGNAITSLAPVGAIDDQKSQLEEVMYVVLTQYVTDVFDLPRERPIAVVPWGTSMTVDLAHAVWPKPLAAADVPSSGGRVRFLRLLRSRKKDDGGFDNSSSAPMDLFTVDMLAGAGGDVDMNPSDAKGMILGVSDPIEWRRM